MGYYIFDDSEQAKRFERNKHFIVPPAGMRKYFEWRRLVRDYGYDPRTAAANVFDGDPEKLEGDTYTIRLTNHHRVVFTKRGNNVTVITIGGHHVKR